MYIYIYIYTYIYTYLYIERERERDRHRLYIYIYVSGRGTKMSCAANYCGCLFPNVEIKIRNVLRALLSLSGCLFQR